MKISPRLRISRSALLHNLAQIRQIAPASKVLAVIKANAYGHGLHIVSRMLAGQVEAFGVARSEDAQALRNAGIQERIVLLNTDSSEELLHFCMHWQVEPVIHEEGLLKILLTIPADKKIRVWLKLDTGMHRLGLRAPLFSTACAQLSAHPAIEELICMTHFANAGERDQKSMQKQLQMLQQSLPNSSLPLSAANSAALLCCRQTHLDWVRPGIMLYGASPFSDLQTDLRLRLPMQLDAPLLSIRTVAVGETVGYGGCWRASRPSRIGTIAIGYANGLPAPMDGRSLPVLCKKKRCRTVGRVSMDLTSVDLTECPEAQIGDWVRLWGAGLPIEEFARASGFSTYELLSRVSKIADSLPCD